MSSRGPPPIEGMTSLKVDNLTYATTMDELERAFKKYGEIGDIYIPRDNNTRESRGKFKEYGGNWGQIATSLLKIIE